jgi:hypothetical protein
MLGDYHADLWEAEMRLKQFLTRILKNPDAAKLTPGMRWQAALERCIINRWPYVITDQFDKRWLLACDNSKPITCIWYEVKA